MVATLNKPPTVSEYEGVKPPKVSEYESFSFMPGTIRYEIPKEPARLRAWEPGLKERVKNVISGMAQRSPFIEPGKRLGQLGLHHLSESVSGIGLYIPDILASKITQEDTLASAVDKITGFEPTPRDVRAGESAKFITSLQSVGRILGPAIAAIPARPALQIILGSGVSFGGRRATEELAKKITTGKPIDIEGIHFESGIGVLFGAGAVGVSKFVSWIKNFRALPKAQIRPARAEVNAALKHYQKTGDRARWDAVRIKYAGIKPEGISRIRARGAPPEVREFGRYPLARPVKAPPTRAIIAPRKPVAPITPEKAVEVADMTLDALKKESAIFDKKIETEIARLDKIAPERQIIAEPGISHLSQEDVARYTEINYEIARRTGISQAEAKKRVAEKRAARLAKPEVAKVEKPKPVKKAKPPTVVEYEAPPMATQAQKAQAHIIAKSKAFVSEKGKMRPGYRRLAKAMTGQTSMARMTEQQAEDFIYALGKLPEPRMKGGKLIPPSIPRTTKLAPKGFFQRRFKRPTPAELITSNTYYAEKLGVKSLVEPLEKAKMRFDLEHRSAANELDRMGQKIDVLGKTTIKERVTAKAKNIPTKAKVEMGDLLDKYENAPAGLDPKNKEIFDWFRNLSRTMLARQNEARAKLELPLIKSRKAYMRHIATDISREMLAGKYPFPEGIGFWSGLNTGKKVFNPMEFQRKLEDDVYGLFTRDPVYASKAMMYNALKEIHLNQPLKFFNEQLNALGKDLPEYKNLSPRERAELDKTTVIPADTRRWLVDYVRTVIKGQQTNTDRLVNNIVNESGLRGLLNTALRPFGRTLSQRPVTRFFQGAGRAQMAGVMGPRPRLLTRNKFQLTQNLALYGAKANIRAFLPPNKELKGLLDESLFLKSYTGLEELPADLAKKVEKLWHKAYQWTATSNARQAMEVAYWDTKELIDNPKYAKYGWKQEHLLKEMEFGAAATQYQYNAIGMPGIFRHKSLIPATRLTSWWMNYFAKFHREALHRAFTGRPSWSDPEGPTLPWSRRLGWLRYAVIGGLILNTMGYTKSYMFGAAPTGWPPAMQAAASLYRYTIADDEKQRKMAKTRFYNAVKTFIPGYIAYKDFNAIWTGRGDLESLFFYKKKKEK